MATRIYFADFETTGKNYAELSGRAEIRAWGISNAIDWKVGGLKKFKFGVGIKSFMEMLYDKKDGSKIYFHNLSFDGDFIIKGLHEFYYLLDLNDNVYTNYLRDDKGKIYSIKLLFNNGKKVELRCTYNLYPSKIADLGASLGYSKLEEDYAAYDLPMDEFVKKWGIGKNPTQFRKERIKYLKRDIEIAYRYSWKDKNDNKLSPFNHRKIPLTQSGNAFEWIKKYNRSEFVKAFEGIETWVFNKKKGYARPHIGNRHLNFDSVAPFLNYRGGFTFFNEKFKNQMHHKVYSIDINSSYPMQYSSRNLPCGEPLIVKGKIDRMHSSFLYFFVVEATRIHATFNPDEMPPFLPRANLNSDLKGRYILNWTAKKGEIYRLGVWSDELEFFDKYYQWNRKIITTYEFETTDYFKRATREAIDLKFNATNPTQKVGAKLFINAAYGKMGQKPYNPSTFYDPKLNSFVKDEIFYLMNDMQKKLGKLRLKKANPVIKKYPPAASYITNLARIYLYKQIEKINNLGGVVYYGDTDSIKFSIDKDITPYLKELNVGDKLGQWKLEHLYTDFKYLGAKNYYSDKTGYTIKGYNGDEIDGLTPETFTYGLIFNDKLRKHSIEGGIYLDTTEYTINETKNYIDVK